MRGLAAILAALAPYFCGAAASAGSLAETEESATAAEIAAVAEKLAGADADRDRLAKAYDECMERLGRPALEVSIPVEAHPDGSVKIDATAERAQFFDKEGLVWCGGVTVREYSPGGDVEMEFRAEGCLVDRKARTGWAPGRVEGRRAGTKIEGSGFYFSFGGEFVRMYGNVRISSTDMDFGGMGL